MLLEPRRELRNPVVELAGSDPSRQFGGRAARVVDLLTEELAEELQVLAVGLIPGFELAGHHRADVGGDEHLEALLARDLGAQLAEQVLGDRLEQLRRGRAVLHHAASINSSRSHSGSQTRRPSEASSWLRRTPVRWSWAWRAQMIAHLALPKTSQ